MGRLAFALIGLGRAWAQDARPLDLDQTRAALGATEAALRDKNLTDADLQTLKAQNGARLALQGAIADLTPGSRRRQAPGGAHAQIGRAAPTTDVAAKELETEKKRHDTLDANLRSARAMPLRSRRPLDPHQRGARQLFARHTFAGSSSILDPQLGRGLAGSSDDTEVRRSLTATGSTRSANDCRRAKSALRRPRSRRARRAPLSGSPAGSSISIRRAAPPAGSAARLPRRGSSSSWRCCRWPPLACWPAPSTPSTFPIRASQGLIEAALDAARDFDRRQRACARHARARSPGLAPRRR